MENYDNTQELEQLRQQVREFKQRLDRQEIISERMLRQSMTVKASWVKNLNVGLSIAGLCFLPILIAILHYGLNASWGPVAFVSIMMVCEATYNFWSTRPLRQSQLATGELLSVKREMLAFKRREKLAMLTEVPLIIVWFLWLVWDVHANNMAVTDAMHRGMADGFSYGAIVGGVIGLAWAFWFYFKSMRKINQIVADIEDYRD